jgi:hypothetical protein
MIDRTLGIIAAKKYLEKKGKFKSFEQILYKSAMNKIRMLKMNNASSKH